MVHINNSCIGAFLWDNLSAYIKYWNFHPRDAVFLKALSIFGTKGWFKTAISYFFFFNFRYSVCLEIRLWNNC